MFSPVFQITAKSTQYLMDIEVSRRAFSSLPVSSKLLSSLRESARLTQTHYSTQIEGNRLTEEQVAAVSKGDTFPNRNRDETEVKNYFVALEYVDKLIRQHSGDNDLSLEMIQTIHGCVMHGRAKPSEYRDGQNVIRESGSGNIIYMPPEKCDVAMLMGEMVTWINSQTDAKELPAPIIAAIGHYQFATIHPYYDGNGRTARLLTNLILHRSGYGMKGIYSLEEYYAKNLSAYYDEISVGDSHNYYMGRAETDISQWIQYFCEGMADSFSRVRSQAELLKENPDQSLLLRELDKRQKLLLSLFRESQFLSTREIAECLGVQSRTTLNLCKSWVESGFILQKGERRGRRYELTEKWQRVCLNTI